MKKKILSLVLALVLALAFTACAGSGKENATAPGAREDYGTESSVAEEGIMEDAKFEEAEAADTAAGGAEMPESVGDALPADRKIIRDTNLRVETKSFDDSVSVLKQSVGAAGGYVEYSSQRSGHSTRSADFTCRIPAEQYGQFLEDMNGVGSVVHIEESTEDATERYIDIESRLKSLRTQEERLLEMMKSSGSLEELLAVQDKLTEVQYQIESYTAQMKSLQSRVSYSTVYITLVEVETYTPVDESFGTRASKAFEDMLSGLESGAQGFVILLIYVSPLLLVAAVALTVILVVLKIKKRKMPKYPEQKQ